VPDPKVYDEYDRAIDILANGTEEELEAFACENLAFPDGVDGFIHRRWITNAIDCGSKRAVEWMLRRGVDLSFRDDEGFTVLHSAIDRAGDAKYDILEALLKAGAPVNAHGIEDWTPAHMAAARGDVAALKLLIEYGADLTIRTRIDHYATPLGEARSLGVTSTARFLEEL
jgi:ankyrin repeat protein